MDVESGSRDTHPSAVVPPPFGHLPPPNHPLWKRGRPPKVHAGPSAVSDIERRGPGRPKKPINPNAPVLEKRGPGRPRNAPVLHGSALPSSSTSHPISLASRPVLQMSSSGPMHQRVLTEWNLPGTAESSRTTTASHAQPDTTPQPCTTTSSNETHVIPFSDPSRLLRTGALPTSVSMDDDGTIADDEMQWELGQEPFHPPTSSPAVV
ncbi:hypothetical protein SCLCIDRAFT_1209256 [Scleroderma citrinum Foug A]|uniref:Uncharacterized protein n=1 Tax=Scleroderma citrinum Foug A TaxID=1036808 RepID=A0A0C3E6L6_9AGAM|nr:hypothetical protein SCLCIDRAFT_1209256 [Scleroderma citrinum Foug A]